MRNRAGKYKGDRSGDTENNPAEGNCNTAVFYIKYFILRLLVCQGQTNGKTDDNGNKKSSKVSFSINNSSQAWKNHKYRLKIKYPSNNIKNNTVIHDCTPYFSRISQILRSPLCVVATIT